MNDGRSVSRFAPAPTGLLHLGHIVNAIHVWGLTRAANGRVLLRIEDHDRQRCRPEFEQAILEDLEWLGFVPDEMVRQSDRDALYDASLSRLRSAGLVYGCECSRSEIAAAAVPGDELRYPGICAAKDVREGFGRGSRVRLEPSIERFDDGRHGSQEQRPFEQCGDLLARDRDGNWTYQFAVTVDDLEQGITLVIRGDDLLASTGRQIQLGRLLGRDKPPAFLHHPLIMKSASQKLSKSDGDTGVRDLRVKGWRPEQVVGYTAHLAGLVNRPLDFAARNVPELFNPKRDPVATIAPT